MRMSRALATVPLLTDARLERKGVGAYPQRADPVGRVSDCPLLRQQPLRPERIGQVARRGPQTGVAGFAEALQFGGQVGLG